MRKIIVHRVNSCKELDSINTSYGVEVDIRTYKNKLVCSHDPLIKGESFKNWLKSYNHSFIIANIKEEGIEEEVIQLIENNNISNYFLLDVSFPFLHKLTKKNRLTNNFIYRISDYEKLCPDFVINNSIKWIWIDAFISFPEEDLNKVYELQKNHEIKICMVSPELHLDRNEEINNALLTKIKFLDVKYDLVCTKNPKLWE